jgi:hypothetical protein
MADWSSANYHGNARAAVNAREANPDGHGQRGRLLKFDEFTVEPILALHGQPDKQITEVMEGRSIR